MDMIITTRGQMLAWANKQVQDTRDEFETYGNALATGGIDYDQWQDQAGQMKGKMYMLRDMLNYLDPQLSWSDVAESALELIENIEDYTGYPESCEDGDEGNDDDEPTYTPLDDRPFLDGWLPWEGEQ